MAASGTSHAHRLTNRKEFDAVFGNASFRVSCPEFLMLAIDNDLAISRIGMVVSKKVSRTCVNRNRIRRLIRESFRHCFDRGGLDIVIVARRPVRQIDNAAMLRLLDRLWQRLANTSVKVVQ